MLSSTVSSCGFRAHFDTLEMADAKEVRSGDVFVRSVVRGVSE